MSEAPFIASDVRTAIRVLDKYEVIRRVAQGGMGEIFLARQTGVAGFNRLVILKTLLPELAEQTEIKDQFLDEARIGANLNHPNIVGIHEIGQWEGLYFLVMEFIDGDTLAGLQRAAAKKKASIPWVVSAQIVRDTAKGLDHAHHALDSSTGNRLNIIHRDVTPQNIMVRLDGVVKVVDFGIAKSAGSDPRTAAGEVKGKLSYLSPEQISGASMSVDHRADQFSLGIVLWELCTGRRLFNQKNPLDIFKKILAHDVPPPTSIVPQVPAALERIVMKMLAHDPTERYARCADAALDLQAWLDSLAGRVDPTSQFVDRLIGEDARARLTDLTPQPVTIVGLKGPPKAPVEELIPCTVCQFPLTARAKFCTECGTPTETSGRMPASPGRPPTGPRMPVVESTLITPSRAAPASIDGLFAPANPVVVAPVGTTPPLGSTPLGSTPLGSTPLGSTPLGSTPLGSMPLVVAPVGSAPFGGAQRAPSSPGFVSPTTPSATNRPQEIPYKPSVRGPVSTTNAADVRARTPTPIALPTVSPMSPGSARFATSTPAIAAGGAALPLDEHVPGMPNRAITSPHVDVRTRTPSSPVQASVVAANPTPALPARTPTPPPIPRVAPMTPSPSPNPPVRPTTRPGMAAATPPMSGAPTPSPASTNFPAPPTPRTAARIIEANVPGGRSLSMDDFFAVPGPSSGAPESRREARRRPVFGRTAELQRATQLLQECAHTTRTLVFMGESGVGKTTLLDEIRASAESLGFVILAGRGTDRGLASPLDLIRSLLIGANDVDEDATIARAIDRSNLPAPVAQRAEAALLGVPGPPSMSAELDHLLYETAVAKLLGTIGHGRSVVIVVDDLHRADIASLRVLGLVPSSVPDGVALFATANLRFDHPSLPLTELAPLDVGSTVKVIEDAAGATLPAEAVRRVLEKAEGNPAYARELVDFLVTEGGLIIDGAMAQPTPALARIAIPPDAAFHTTTRVRCLGNATFDFLKLAASVGVEFSLDELAGAFSRPSEPADAAARAEKEGILVKTAGGRRYRFKRDLYYEIVLRERRQGEVPTLHKRLATAYHGRGVNAAYAEMHQLLLAGEPDPALVSLMHDALAARGLISMLAANLPRAVDIVLSRVAGGQGDVNGLAALATSATVALTTMAPADAVQLATRALGPLTLLPVDGTRLARMYRARGLAYVQQGDYQNGARDLEVASGLAAQHRDPVLQNEILVDLAHALEKSGDIQSAARVFVQSLQGGSARDPGRWRSAVELASILTKTGQSDRAKQLLVEADANVRATESSAGYLRCRIGEAIVLLSEGNAGDAIRILETTLRAATEQADLVAEARLHRELAQVLAKTGAAEQSIGHIQRAAALAKEVGWSQGVVEILGELRTFGRAGLM